MGRSQRAGISHVVADYGGVISCAQPDREVEEMAAMAGLPPADFVDRYWAHRPEYDRGQASDAYWSSVLGRPVPPDLLGRLNQIDLRSWTHLDDDVEHLLHQIHDGGVPVSLLSNAPALLAAWIDAAPWAAFFAHRLYSCRFGVNKPDPLIYRRTLAQIGTPPEATLFVDDRPENTAAARRLGWQAITFTSPADLSSLTWPI